MSEDQLTRIEKTLETLATKTDLQALATKVDATRDDVNALTGRVNLMATRDELKGLATKDDLQALATRANLEATSDDVKALAARVDLTATQDDLQALATRADLEATRDDIKALAARVNLTASAKDLQAVAADLMATKTDLGDLRRHMGVLHEAVRADIRALGEPEAPTRREMRQGFEDLKELLGHRLVPLEAAVKHHSAELKELKTAVSRKRR